MKLCVHRPRWAQKRNKTYANKAVQTCHLTARSLWPRKSANAVRWQVWTALLTYVLLRFCAWLSQWGHSFTRLFALLRSALWQKLELRSLLEVYGTAGVAAVGFWARLSKPIWPDSVDALG